MKLWAERWAATACAVIPASLVMISCKSCNLWDGGATRTRFGSEITFWEVRHRTGKTWGVGPNAAWIILPSIWWSGVSWSARWHRYPAPWGVRIFWVETLWRRFGSRGRVRSGRRGTLIGRSRRRALFYSLCWGAWRCHWGCASACPPSSWWCPGSTSIFGPVAPCWRRWSLARLACPVALETTFQMKNY